MSLTNEQDVVTLRNLGKCFADDALEFFGKNYKQRPEVGEVALFYATATAALAEAMYAFLHANAEKEQADGWLTQLFSMIGQSLQTKNIPLPPGQAAPAAAASIEPAAAPAVKRTKTACICAVEPTGICHICPGQIKESVRKAILPLGDCLRNLEQGLGQIGGKKPCAACTEAYLDAAVASVLMSGSLGELSPDVEPFIDQIYEALYRWALGRGVDEMVLTEKAWAIFSGGMEE